MPEELIPQTQTSQTADLQPSAVDTAIQARETAQAAAAKPTLAVHEGGYEQWRELPDSVSTTEQGAVEIRDDAEIGNNTVLNTAPDPTTTIARTGGNGPHRKISIVEETPVGTYSADYRLGALHASGRVSNPPQVGPVKVTRAEGQYQQEIKSPQNREKAGAIIAKMAVKDASNALNKSRSQVIEDRKLVA